MNEIVLNFGMGLGLVLVLIAAGVLAIRYGSIQVEEQSSVVLTRFGKWIQHWERPGLHWSIEKLFPWSKLHVVSRKVNDLVLPSISIHDRDGTSMLVDVWVEFRVKDPRKLLFAVENWREAFQGLLTHSVTSVISGYALEDVFKTRVQLEKAIVRDASQDLDRWGVELQRLMILDLTLFPDVNQRILAGISSHLDKKKALIEEEGRMRSERIEAETEREIATLKGTASVQMALAVGRAYEELKNNQEVFTAYERLHELSLYSSESLVVFDGFENTLKTIDAAQFLGMMGQQPSVQ